MKTLENLESVIRGDDARHCRVSLSGVPSGPIAKCKLAKLNFVAGAEIPKRYLS